MAVDYSSPNLRIWSAVEKTDPKFVKAITGKAYKGTSPSPHWIKLRLTETFGPAGIGWGTNVLSERFETIGNTVMHYIHIRLWYVLDGERGEIEEHGGTQLGGLRKDGTPFADEDAPKKSMTDALVKAASALGFAADIFLGRWDDNKYVADREQEETKAARATEAKADAVNIAKLTTKVRTLVEDLTTITTQEAFAACRADALVLRPQLIEAGLKELEQTMGAAVTSAAARLKPAQQQAA